MPTRAMIGAQQAAIAGFQTIYNEDRPHEARRMKVPAEFYDVSPRCSPDKLPE
jgi:transposase InsO family protein